MIFFKHFAIGLVCLVCSGPGTASSDTQAITIRGDVRVFDGDTLEIGPMLIRLHGVDAPERGQRCELASTGKWNCGRSASGRLESLIEGQKLDCEALDRDPYGRIISCCYAGGVDIDRQLVIEGLAWAFTKFSKDYVAQEVTAREAFRGVWQADTQTPWDYRDDKWNRAVADAPDGKCPIKGNINASKGKEKIYHTPWSSNYGKTKIDEERGERWFCDEAEALAAGWRAVAH